jgi:MFS family permease
VLGFLLRGGDMTTTAFMALLMAAFFLASAGASSAYLTVSEVFPMEIRGLAIALFYAVGTAVGGISGPLFFGNVIHSGDVRLVALGFFVGAAAMAVGGIAELALGVRAEGKSLENIATPLTAEEAEGSENPEADLVAEVDAGTQSTPGKRRDAGPPRLGPGSAFYSPSQIGTAGTTSRWAAASDEARKWEIDVIVRSVDRHGPMTRDALEGYIGGRFWGPGRFSSALRRAVAGGRVRRVSRHSYVGGGTSERASSGR